MFEVTPEGALRYTRISVCLVFTWPLKRDATRLERFVFEIFLWISTISPLIMTLILFNATRYQLDDSLSLTKSFCIGVACAQVVSKMLICRLQRDRFEMLHREVEDFLAAATAREREVLRIYANRCAAFHVAINVCAFMANLAMVCGPLILPQSLPVMIPYPFSVSENPAFVLAYFHQTMVGFQCASNGSVDCQASLLVWFAGARLQLLAEEFERVTSVGEFDRCIKKHQFLLDYAEESMRAARLIILTTICTTVVSVITGGVQIVISQPLVVKSQFFIIAFGFIGELFISAWAAENLINMSRAIGQGAYNCCWTQGSIRLRKRILIVMHRAQKHISISVAGLLPELSLSYYASFVSKTYSFFTALRIVIDKEMD